MIFIQVINSEGLTLPMPKGRGFTAFFDNHVQDDLPSLGIHKRTYRISVMPYTPPEKIKNPTAISNGVRD